MDPAVFTVQNKYVSYWFESLEHTAIDDESLQMSDPNSQLSVMTACGVLTDFVLRFT